MTGRNYSVQDVSGNPEYWGRDIDFIITSPTSGLTKSFEVKWDTKIHNTNNLYLETENIHSKGGKGWLEFCEADYLVYGDAFDSTFYIIPMPELKDRLNDLPQRVAHCGYESTGLLVSLNDIEDIYTIL